MRRVAGRLGPSEPCCCRSPGALDRFLDQNRYCITTVRARWFILAPAPARLGIALFMARGRMTRLCSDRGTQYAKKTLVDEVINHELGMVEIESARGGQHRDAHRAVDQYIPYRFIGELTRVRQQEGESPAEPFAFRIAAQQVPGRRRVPEYRATSAADHPGTTKAALLPRRGTGISGRARSLRLSPTRSPKSCRAAMTAFSPASCGSGRMRRISTNPSTRQPLKCAIAALDRLRMLSPSTTRQQITSG
jgi:hypothetical protein